MKAETQAGTRRDAELALVVYIARGSFFGRIWKNIDEKGKKELDYVFVLYNNASVRKYGVKNIVWIKILVSNGVPLSNEGYRSVVSAQLTRGPTQQLAVIFFRTADRESPRR